MGGALAVLIAIALIIKLGGGAAARLAERMLAGQNVVSGTLSYEKINAGFAGDVEIRNLVWKAPNGETKLEMPLVTASVNFFDALRQGGGISSVTNIVLNKPKFYGIYEEGQGLDILNLLKLAGQSNLEIGKKSEQEVKPTRFRGLIEVKDGMVDLNSNGKKVSLNKMNAQMAFKQYPLLRASATASKDSCDLVLNMIYEKGEARVTGEAKNMEAADLLAMYPDLKHIKINGGTVPTVKISASKDTGGWHITLEGSPRKMSGEFFGMAFEDGEGKFTADRDEAAVRDFTARVNEMPVAMEGTIKSGRGTPLPPVFDLSFSGKQFKTRALSKGLYLNDAAVDFSGKLTGNAVEPKIEGTFSCDYLYAAPLKMRGLQGVFARDTGGIRLKTAEALSAGAKIGITGFISLPAKDFNFTMSGNNLDAAQLTDNKVTGLLQMQAQISGTDQPDSATGTGRFSMQKGRYFYTDGNLRNEEIRFLQGDVVIQNSIFGTRNGEMKLGRNKYSVSLTAGEKEIAELKVGKKLSSSLF